VLECAGLTLVFFGANVALGVGAILAARALTGVFVSLYLAHDLVLLVLSLFQALVFTWWRAPSPGQKERAQGGGAIDHT
jgi:predicted ABC-type sugar transport system permease subunit